MQNCKVSDWTAWEPCDASCGTGQTKRSREITQKPQEGGAGCGLDLVQLQPCGDIAPCPVADCLWSDWSEWSGCTADCDGGQKTRYRHIATTPGKGGRPCTPEHTEEVDVCNVHKCANEMCIDGAWGEWQDWQPCSSSCKGGVTWRARTVSREANFCGTPATGPMRTYGTCN